MHSLLFFHYREYYFLDNDVILIRDSYSGEEADTHPTTISYYQAVTDNLGSIIAVYDNSKCKVFEASYDAWGKQTVTLDEIGLYRGFTGHENVGRSELIHMDGRVYDPATGRFLSPDNYVQLPENSQSFNRYSYCLNNPLKYTDPSGQIFGVIGGLIRGTINIFVKGDILAPVKEGLHGLGLDIKLLGGLFQGNFTQILSRNTWESLQTGIGLLYSEYNLLTHNIEAIEYYDGATYVLNKNKDKTNGVSIGSYININDTHDFPYDENGNFAPYKNIMYMHEYGHYIQSQRYGFGYLFSVGIPSLWSLSVFGDGKEKYIGNVTKHRYRWFERSANKKAEKYFEGLYDKWDYINYPIK